ncbi:MAG TPA: hypothetical protein DCO79_01160 [Spirochaeta sp.]|nr:hypothetical protein [Spirochaeta sp.]
MYDIVTIGEALIDLAAVETGLPLSEVTSFKRVAGGAPANVAVGSSKLGRKSGLITRVGDEAFGKHIIDVVGKFGVETSGIQKDTEVNTGLAFIGLPTPYTREFLFYRNPGADMRIDFSEIPSDLLLKTKIFHFGSISLINEPSAASTLKAVKAAKDAGAIISYDPNLRMSLWPDEKAARDTIMSVVKYADIIKVNGDEMEFIFKSKDLEAGAQKLLNMGAKVILCTKGELGSLFATKHFTGTKDVIKLDSVDSTGCGDSFLSGIFSILSDYSIEDITTDQNILEKAVGFGAAAAAITSTMRGVTDALPNRKKVQDLLEKIKNG